jgi:hypothetical protein
MPLRLAMATPSAALRPVCYRNMRRVTMRRMAASSSPPPTTTRPRHTLRYSLRALLIFLTLACVGVWYWYRVPYKKEVIHPKALPIWKEKAGFALLAKEEQRYRRVLRGEPIRDGLTEWFDTEGHRLGQEYWREGKLHGPWIRWYSTGVVQERGEYDRGRKHGLWERFDEEGQIAVRMPFDRGAPHGDWQWFENGKPVRTIRFDHTEVTQIDGRPVNDPLGRACRLGQIDNERIKEMMTRSGWCDFQNTPLKEVADFLAENYKVNVLLHRRIIEEAGVQADAPISLQVDNITAGAMLVLLFEPHSLATTYRFGMIWVTTKEDAKNWVDHTGLATALESPPPEVLPSHRSKIAAALQQPADFDFLDTPLQDVAGFLSETYRVPLACNPDIKDLPVTSNLHAASLQNALGALCDQYDLRVRWKDGKTLVIEPQEGAD